ncbi:hypothetical protein ScPMuIL_004889 [Solemya velum]
MVALDINDPVSVLKFLRGSLIDNFRLNKEKTTFQPLKASPSSCLKPRGLSREPPVTGSPSTIKGIQCSFMEDENTLSTPQFSPMIGKRNFNTYTNV